MNRGLPVLSFLSLLLVCAARAAAQSPPAEAAAAEVAADAPAGVAVVKFNWQRVPRRTEWDAPLDSAASQTLEDPRTGHLPRDGSGGRAPNPVGRPTSSRDRSATTRNTTTAVGASDQADAKPASGGRGGGDDYVYRLRVRNDGARRVESVDWEYLFFDAETKKEVGRHRFVSQRRAKPGETFTLDATSAAPPARVVSAAVLDRKRARPFAERVVVRCVAYSDGTFARREGAAETDCDGVRAAASRARRQ